MTKVKLYLDDNRTPYDKEFEVVRDFKEFVEYITNNGIPDYISLDHDLDQEHYSKYMYLNDVKPYNALYDLFKKPTGLHAAIWLISEIKKSGKYPKINVHSKNPIGSSNIFWELTNFYVSCGKDTSMITKDQILFK